MTYTTCLLICYNNERAWEVCKSLAALWPARLLGLQSVTVTCWPMIVVCYICVTLCLNRRLIVEVRRMEEFTGSKC